MHTMTIRRTAGALLAAVAIAGGVGVPAASARPIYGPGTPGTPVPQGGWPDMHASTAIAAAQARHRYEVRVGDAHDAWLGRPDDTVATAKPAVPIQSARISPPSGGGMDWGDAGIGAGGTLVMILLAAGGVVAVGHRRRGEQSARIA